MSPFLSALLPYFLTVAETGSLTAASAVHAITQPALSRRIGQLEQGLGTKLFVRRARGMSLTPAGEILLRRARLIRMEEQRASDEIGHLNGEGERWITIMAGPAWALAVLPEVLRDFAVRFPDYRVDVTVVSKSPSVEAVATGDVSLYLGGLDVTECRRLGLEVFEPRNLDYLVYAKTGHPMTEDESVDARALAAHPWSVYRDDGAWEFFGDMLQRQAGRAPRVAMQSTSLFATLEHAATSGTLVAMSEPVGRVARKLDLVPLVSQPLRFSFPSGFCYASSAEHFTPLAHLIDLLRDDIA